MITPRRTRLLRVPDLHEFRRVIGALVRGADASSLLVVVPTRGAGRQLRRLCPEVAQDAFVTRDQLYERLHQRLTAAPRRLAALERDGMAQAAAASASLSLAATGEKERTAADAVPGLPFRLRPGLVAEILRFYDHLRRQSQQVKRFEELIELALGAGETAGDRGSERLLRQTRFLARTFRDYERRLRECGACDEHTLRDRLIGEPLSRPIRHVVVTVPDWIADPDGLFVADFDLLAQLPGLEMVDVVCTDALLGSGFHERVHTWLPGLEEVGGSQVSAGMSKARPVLVSPGAASGQQWFTHRDRHEELMAVARRIHAARLSDPEALALDRLAVVFKRPLPYLYVASDTIGGAGLPYQTVDALPLAAEPTAAAVDLVLDLVTTGFAREAIVRLLRSPHFVCAPSGSASPATAASPPAGEISREAISALDRALSKARYLGDLPRLEEFAAAGPVPEALPALDAALGACRELAPLLEAAPASTQVRRLLAFVAGRARPLGPDDPLAPRERRVRAAILDTLSLLADAHATHHDPPWGIDELAGAVRRWIEEETFVPDSGEVGVHLLDDQAARYGDFDDMTIVGMVESEWPERPRRNIFYPPGLLKALGWPSERERRAADDARFLDLLASASRRVTLSTFTLDDEALVRRSAQLDEIPRARLSTLKAEETEGSAPFGDDALASASPAADAFGGRAREWLDLRLARPAADAPEFHGRIGSFPERPWSVSALETYLGCPFKFFAQHVLQLAEEPEDEEVMDPRRQGQFMHGVFEAFFGAWQAAGHGAITPANLDRAREMFTTVVDRELERLPPGEAGLERTRLLGSPAAAGLGEAVLRMEAERPAAVVERMLEHRLTGEFTIATTSGPRTVSLRGKADRLDLLGDGTFRLIDYKLGWPPHRALALQLPIYGLCAEQQLGRDRGRRWTLGEAAYVAFKGPRRVVPLFSSSAERDVVLAAAQQRLADTLDTIGRGEFPPAPDDVHRCETCSFAPVCRKDYVE